MYSLQLNNGRSGSFSIALIDTSTVCNEDLCIISGVLMMEAGLNLYVRTTLQHIALWCKSDVLDYHDSYEDI